MWVEGQCCLGRYYADRQRVQWKDKPMMLRIKEIRRCACRGAGPPRTNARGPSLRAEQRTALQGSNGCRGRVGPVVMLVFFRRKNKYDRCVRAATRNFSAGSAATALRDTPGPVKAYASVSFRRRSGSRTPVHHRYGPRSGTAREPEAYSGGHYRLRTPSAESVDPGARKIPLQCRLPCRERLRIRQL